MHDFLSLQVSFAVNCGCIVVAIIGAILISVDLARWKQENDPFLRVRVTPKLIPIHLSAEAHINISIVTILFINDVFCLWQIEVMGLCVLGLEVFLSAILCFWFFKEKKAKWLNCSYCLN